MSYRTVTMRHDHDGFLLLSLLLCSASLCPEMTHDRDLLRSMT